MVQTFRRNPNVAHAGPNFIASIGVETLVPVDQNYAGQQWNLDRSPGGIEMEKAWAWMLANSPAGLPGGDPDVVVAVLDTGVAYEDYDQLVPRNRKKFTVISYYQAPDLNETNFVAGWDFINDDAHPNDDEGHGTHVTGTIAQSTSWTGDTDYAHGVAGIAPDVSIMPVKVLGADGSGSYATIIEGIYFAADEGADVINMSLTGPVGDPLMEEALRYACVVKGVTIVCSTGNDDGGPVGCPAAYDGYCIAVGGTGYDTTIAPYSNVGPEVDIAAPGGNVLQDLNGDGYGDGILQQTFGASPGAFGLYFYQGTSMAAPHVAGVAALVISSGVTGPNNVRAALESNAKDLGDPGWDPIYGHGLLDAYAALTGVPVAEPDVAVAIVSLPAAVLGGSATKVTVDVTNTGNAGTSSVTVALADPVGGLVSPAIADVGSLAAGESRSVDFTWTPAAVTAPEARALQAISVAEGDSNASNDSATASVLVTRYTTNIKVVGMVAPESATVGQVQGIDVTVANQGLAQETFLLTLGDDSGSPAESLDVTLQAGQAQTVTLDWTAPDTEGIYTLTATADVTDEVATDNAVHAEATVNSVSTIHVSGVDMVLIRRAIFTSAEATVSIVDAVGAAVPGAEVSVAWGGALNGTASGLTNADGQAILASASLKKAKSGTELTVTVTDVVKGAMPYEPLPGVPTSAKVIVP
ncbi:MAG: S8 family serine peptidase [Victivallales bacterium]|nr:S8 family serine peptidase [Victivallales bacterium]